MGGEESHEGAQSRRELWLNILWQTKEKGNIKVKTNENGDRLKGNNNTNACSAQVTYGEKIKVKPLESAMSSTTSV